jgi:hypothetical protein
VPGGVAEVCRKGYLWTSPEATFSTVEARAKSGGVFRRIREHRNGRLKW